MSTDILNIIAHINGGCIKEEVHNSSHDKAAARLRLNDDLITVCGMYAHHNPTNLCHVNDDVKTPRTVRPVYFVTFKLFLLHPVYIPR